MRISRSASRDIPSLKLTARTWNTGVGRWVLFWEGLLDRCYVTSSFREAILFLPDESEWLTLDGTCRCKYANYCICINPINVSNWTGSFKSRKLAFLQKEKLNEAFGDGCKNTPMSTTLYFSKPEHEKSWNISSNLNISMGFNKKKRSNWTLHPHNKKKHAFTSF